VRLTFTRETRFDDDAELETVVRPPLGPLLARYHAEFAAVHADQHSSRGPYFHELHISAATRGRTLEQLYDIADAADTLLRALADGEVTRQTALDLIVGGRADLLAGMPEGPCRAARCVGGGGRLLRRGAVPEIQTGASHCALT
jgi:hypothetical protein